MFKCRKCRTFVSGNCNFCPQCGLAEPAELICRHCRHEVSKTDKFCGNCRAEQDSGVAPASASGTSLKTKLNASPNTRPNNHSRPGLFWPETAFGNLVYLVVIAGATLFGIGLARSEGAENASPVLLGACFAGSALMILTLWRIKFVTRGALTRPQPSSVAADEQQPTQGGISWSGIFWIFLTAAAIKLIREWTLNLP